MTPNIPLIAWDPDGDPTRPGVLAEVDGLIPTRRGFVSELAPGSYNSVTLPGKCYGGNLVTLPSGDHALLLATATNLYVYAASIVLTQRSRSTGGAYIPTTWPGVTWRFAQFGEQTLAIHRENVLQASDDIITTNFADVSGAPSAYTMCVASNFVMVANTEDVAAANTYRFADAWWCSALGDHTDWTPSLATQCDQGRLRETPGPILRLFAYGPDVLAFKRNSIIRGRYVNRPADGIIWQWTTITSEIGIVGHDAICQVGGIVYFLSADGVYAFNGSALQRIDSFPRLWFARHAASNVTPADAFLALTQAVYDPVRRVIRWHFTENEDAQQSEVWMGGCLIYHPETDRWGFSSLHDSEWAINVPGGAFLLPDSGDYLNTELVGVNDVAFEARGLAAYVNASDHEIKTYISTATISSMTTGDIGDDDAVVVGVRARLRFLRAPSSATMRHYHRMNLGGDLTEGQGASRVDGKFDFSHSARWHRLLFQMVGPVEVTGMRFAAEQAGKG